MTNARERESQTALRGLRRKHLLLARGDGAGIQNGLWKISRIYFLVKGKGEKHLMHKANRMQGSSRHI